MGGHRGVAINSPLLNKFCEVSGVCVCGIVWCGWCVVCVLCVCCWLWLWLWQWFGRPPLDGPPPDRPPPGRAPQDRPPPTTQNIALFLSVHCHNAIPFFLLVGVFSWKFGGVFEGRGPQMCTFGLSGCRVKPRGIQFTKSRTPPDGGGCEPEKQQGGGPKHPLKVEATRWRGGEFKKNERKKRERKKSEEEGDGRKSSPHFKMSVCTPIEFRPFLLPSPLRF